MSQSCPFILHHATFKQHVRLAEHRGTDCDPRIKTRQAVGRGMLQLHLDIGGSLMQVKSFADHFFTFHFKIFNPGLLVNNPRGSASCETDLTESVGCIRLALAVARKSHEFGRFGCSV